ncbi:MAG: PqqD family protein [Thiohalobacterales bacterium]|nr:PqqD family protein [Thiohalobacterales bacterium]
MLFASTRQDLTVREVEGETVVLDRNAGMVHTLNPTASFIWQLLDGNTSGDDIARQLAEQYDIDIRVAENDVRCAIKEMSDLKLITLSGG